MPTVPVSLNKIFKKRVVTLEQVADVAILLTTQNETTKEEWKTPERVGYQLMDFHVQIF
jgi:hypothetical protein